MKKVLCLCMAFLLCFMAVSCAAAEAAVDVTAEDVFGKVEGDDYVNDFIGLGFKLDGWHFCTDEEIDAMNSIAKATLTEDYAKYAEQVGNLYVMMAIAPDGTNINISLKNLGEYADLYKMMGMETIAKSSVESTISVLNMSGYQNVSVEYIQTLIEDQAYDGLMAKFELQGQALCSKLVMLICDKYLATVTITGREEAQVNEAFPKLYHLK